MPKTSAGILLYKFDGDRLLVLLVHPGGPFWSNRDLGAWSIPKGEYEPDEEPEAAARREFLEETGIAVMGSLTPLGETRLKNGKLIVAYGAESDFDLERLRSNMFEIEWPPRSGRTQAFPEVDRAGWFTLPEAREKINPAQRLFLNRLETACNSDVGSPPSQ